MADVVGGTVGAGSGSDTEDGAGAAIAETGAAALAGDDLARLRGK